MVKAPRDNLPKRLSKIVMFVLSGTLEALVGDTPCRGCQIMPYARHELQDFEESTTTFSKGP
jgi:hypothetical protein